MGNVRCTEAMWKQDFKILSEEFVAGIAEHLLRTAVDDGYAAIGGHTENGLRCCFEERTQLILAGEQFRFDMMTQLLLG